MFLFYFQKLCQQVKIVLGVVNFHIYASMMRRVFAAFLANRIFFFPLRIISLRYMYVPKIYTLSAQYFPSRPPISEKNLQQNILSPYYMYRKLLHFSQDLAYVYVFSPSFHIKNGMQFYFPLNRLRSLSLSTKMFLLISKCFMCLCLEWLCIHSTQKPPWLCSTFNGVFLFSIFFFSKNSRSSG